MSCKDKKENIHLHMLLKHLIEIFQVLVLRHVVLDEG